MSWEEVRLIEAKASLVRASQGPELALAEAEAQRALEADEREHEMLRWKAEQDRREHEMFLARLSSEEKLAAIRAGMVFRLALVIACAACVLLPLSWAL